MQGKVITKTYLYTNNPDWYDAVKKYNGWDGSASASGKGVLYSELNGSGSPSGVPYTDVNAPHELYRIVPSAESQPGNKCIVGYRLSADSARSTRFNIKLTASAGNLDYSIVAMRNNGSSYDPYGYDTSAYDVYHGYRRYVDGDTTISFTIIESYKDRSDTYSYGVAAKIPKGDCSVSGRYQIHEDGYYFGDPSYGVMHGSVVAISGNTGTNTAAFKEYNYYHAPTYVTALYILKDNDGTTSDTSYATCDVSIMWDYIITSRTYMPATLQYYGLDDMSSRKTTLKGGYIEGASAKGTNASFISTKDADVGIWGTYESNTDVFATAPYLSLGSDTQVFLKSYSCINKSSQTTAKKYPATITGTFDANGKYTITIDDTSTDGKVFSYVVKIDVSVNGTIQTITSGTLTAGTSKKTLTGTISPFHYWGDAGSSVSDAAVIDTDSATYASSSMLYTLYTISVGQTNNYQYSDYISATRTISCNITTYPNTYAFEDITSTSDITAYSVSSSIPLLESISGYLYIPLEDNTQYRAPWTLDGTHDTYTATTPKFTAYSGVVGAGPMLEIYTSHAYSYILLTPTVNGN